MITEARQREHWRVRWIQYRLAQDRRRGMLVETGCAHVTDGSISVFEIL